MKGCCYSCNQWKFAKIKQAVFDVKKEFTGEEIIFEFGGREIRIPSWKYSITESMNELIKGIKDGSVRYCNERLIRPWDFCDKIEPKYESAYLSCWTGEGCPFKERCYKECSQSYFI
ncbi:MAG: hypothetical protein QMD22_00655 [archaeon]|nr:hypothetical protein [archaeon]